MPELRIVRLLKAKWEGYYDVWHNADSPKRWRVRVPYRTNTGAECAFLFDTHDNRWIKRVGGYTSGQMFYISLDQIPEYAREDVQGRVAELLLKREQEQTAKAERRAAWLAGRRLLKPSASQKNEQNARNKLAMWQRKLKLAETKIKHYAKKVKRYDSRKTT